LVVSSLPVDKAPGPDGFNVKFLKSCWHIIKQDFYNLCQDFYEHNLSLKSLNDSLITLIPKKSAPESPNDFRPISLLNSALKLITKILANRLQEVIIKLVRKNQYGFIKTRTIQDCLAWSFEYLYHCKHSSTGTIILKLDFEKAFDLIEHSTILQILKRKGFDDKWLGWINNILSSATSSVLLNGVPGKKFFCKRGVRQGDPLSPLLFVESADLLQDMVNELSLQGRLIAPVIFEGQDYPILQYADDTLLFLEASFDHLQTLKTTLLEFQKATGLKVNFHKSCLVPINIDVNYATCLAEFFECSVGKMPFTYLGLPLGTTRPTVRELAPLTDRVERRLNACSRFLSYGGKLIFVNSVLSSLPTFYMCMLKLNKTVVKVVNRARQHCLWDKQDRDHQNSLAAWELVCKPKEKGGLGVINLEIQNDALLMKHLFKFFNQHDTPWVSMVWQAYYQSSPPQATGLVGSFWWRDVCKLLTVFRGITTVEPGNGRSILFWKDRWDTELLAIRYPMIYSIAIDTDVSLQTILACQDLGQLGEHFATPISVRALDELTDIEANLQMLKSDATRRSISDRWAFFLQNGVYSSMAFYKYAFSGLQVSVIFKKLWKSRCLNKQKVFAWLILVDRINTRDMMNRRHWVVTSGLDCAICGRSERETKEHLFFNCGFARRIWQILGIIWTPDASLTVMFEDAKNSFQGPNFMEVAICALWGIWKCRNKKIFENIQPSVLGWKEVFRYDLELIIHRVKPAHKNILKTWLRDL
jgi:hypothetical protein